MTAKPTISMPAKDLAAACRRACWAIPKRSKLPILDMAHVSVANGEATFTSTDGVMVMSFRVPALGEGEMLLPARTISKQLATSTSDVVYTVEDGKAVGRTRTMTFRHPTLPVSEFQRLAPEGDYTGAFIANLDQLGWCFQQTEAAMSNEETRYYLKGVHMGHDTFEGRAGLRFVATDGHRLHRAGLPEAKPLLASIKLSKVNAIIPAAAVDTLLRLMRLSEPDEHDNVVEDVTVRQFPNVVVFEGPTWTVTTAPVNGTFPDHLRLIPKRTDSATKATVDAFDFQEALVRIATVSSVHSSVAVKLTPKGKIDLHMKGEGADGNESLDAGITGKAMLFGIAAKHLIQALHHVEGRAEICVTSPASPLRINDPDERDFVQVIMPVPLHKAATAPAQDAIQEAPAKTPKKASKAAPRAPAPTLATNKPKAPRKAPAAPAQAAA